MNPKHVFAVVFPLLFLMILIVGYCIKGLVGPNNAWTYGAMIVLMIGTSFIPPNDPDEDSA